jgi:hypothetical protein
VDGNASGTWEHWYLRIVSDSEPNGRDPTITQGKLGPEPQFDLNGLGSQQNLLAVGQGFGDVRWDLFGESVKSRGKLVVGGRVDGSVAAVTAGMLDGEAGAATRSICLVVATSDTSGASCRKATDAATFDAPLYVGLGAARLATGPLVAVAVPPQTSVVGLVSGDGQYWQRPRGGLVLFVRDLTKEFELTYYAASGEVLAEWSNQAAP